MSASSSSAPSAAATAALKSSARSLQSYIGRLPLLTRAVAFAIPIVHVLSWFGAPLADMWALDPAKMDLTQMHRLNTYPLVHTGVLHAAMNLVALTPLLDRFEKEVGTLKTALLIAGPIVTFPAGLYLGIEMGIFREMQSVVGASALVFTLLAIEAVKTAGFQPHYNIIGYEIPTWYTPIFWMVLVSFLMPGSSLLGHFCGLIIGYAYACRYLRLLEPSEWILTKVEQRLGFVLRRLPWYVDLEMRQELNYMEMLPAVGGGPRNGGLGREEEAEGQGEGAGASQSAFSMPGRTLGA